MPARFALQLYALAQGLVLVAGGTSLTTADRRRLARVAWHGIPVLRRTVLHVLAQAQRPPGTRAVATTVQCPATTVRRTLQDLQVLKLVRCVKGGTAMPMAGSSVTKGARRCSTCSSACTGSRVRRRPCGRGGG